MVEYGAPNAGVGGSSPSTPAKKKWKCKSMFNPIKFAQNIKQEAFKVTWPTSKETLQGTLMVVAMAIIASLFFLFLDQVLKFLLELLLKVSI